MGRLYGCFTLIVVLYMVVPAKSQFGKRCTGYEVKACAKELSQVADMYTSIGAQLQTHKRICNTEIPSALRCLDQVSDACERYSNTSPVKRAIQMISQLFRYICTEETIEGFTKHQECFSKSTIETDLKVCNNTFQAGIKQAVRNKRLCEALHELGKCITRPLEVICNKDAALFLEKYYLSIMEIIMDDLLKTLGMPCTFNVQQITDSTVQSNAASTGYFTLHHILIIVLGLLGAALSHDMQY